MDGAIITSRELVDSFAFSRGSKSAAMPNDPMEYIWPGIIAAQAIHAAAKLRVPDLLASGPKTIAELASESGAHPPTLERLLRVLTTFEMFASTPDGRFRNTSLTERLRSDYPGSRRDGAMLDRKSVV